MIGKLEDVTGERAVNSLMTARVVVDEGPIEEDIVVMIVMITGEMTIAVTIVMITDEMTIAVTMIDEVTGTGVGAENDIQGAVEVAVVEGLK